MKKELRELFRDKRVRGTAFIGPIVLIFGLMFLFSSVIGGLAKPSSTKVHVITSNSPYTALFKTSGFQIVPVASVEEGKKLLTDGKARVVVEFLPVKDGVTPMKVRFDEREQLSVITKERVSAVANAVNEKQRELFMKASSIPASSVAPIQVSSENIGAKDDSNPGELLVSLLPYLIVIWAFYGGMGSAADMVAGEKERATLETLLITPISRTQIALGKTAALGVICLLSSLSSLVGLALFALIKPKGSEIMFKNGLGVTLPAFFWILVLLLPLVAFFASMLVALSAYAKNSREAQTYLGLGSFIVVMPAMFSQFIGLTDYSRAQWVNLVPVLNTAANIRSVLIGKTDIPGIAITVLVCSVLAAIMLRIAIVLFNREKVLARN